MDSLDTHDLNKSSTKHDLRVAISKISKVNSENVKGLSPDELTILETKQSKEDRWLTGRILAKETLNSWLKDNGEESIPFCDISILPNNDGQPIFWGNQGNNLDFVVSISHSHDYTVVGICPISNEIALGIDLEKIRFFDPKTITAFMTPSEKNIYNQIASSEKDKFSTMIWTAKESILKALGTGLRIHPNRLELEFEKDWQTVKSVGLDNKKLNLDLSWTIYNRFYMIASTQLYGKFRQRHSLGGEGVYCQTA